MITRTMPISRARICSYLIMPGVVEERSVNDDYGLRGVRFYAILRISFFPSDFYLFRKHVFFSSREERWSPNVNNIYIYARSFLREKHMV